MGYPHTFKVGDRVQVNDQYIVFQEADNLTRKTGTIVHIDDYCYPIGVDLDEFPRFSILGDFYHFEPWELDALDDLITTEEAPC